MPHINHRLNCPKIWALALFLCGAAIGLSQAAAPPCAQAQTMCASNQVDVVFIMDTSGSMNDEFNALCGGIQTLVAALQSRGIQVTVTILGIAENRACTGGFVSSGISGATAFHQEDWAAATRDVAVGHPWQPGATRLIIPMSDEGPAGGDPCQSPGPDADAVTTAAATARRNGVRVAPILGTGFDFCTQTLADQLAQGTGGQVFLSTTPANDLANGIMTIIQTTACDTDGDGLPDDQDPFPNDPCRPNIQAVCLPPQICGLTSTPHWDDDNDGQSDEEQQNGADDDGDGLIDEDVGGVNCPFPAQDCGVNNHRHFDDDADGATDEEQDNNQDDDHDGYIDEDIACACPPPQDMGINAKFNVDDDGDFYLDEEQDDNVDDDGDGCIDEDIGNAPPPTPTPAGCPPPQSPGTDDTPGVDDDHDGQTDEEFADGFDNDEDGCVDEDVQTAALPPRPTPAPNASAVTVLVLDVSGSMANPWQGGIKIQSARDAAAKVINIIEQDSRLPGAAAADDVAVVSFSTTAALAYGPGTDYAQARAALAALQPQDKTNMGAGLEIAAQLLQSIPDDRRKVIFLLSDGEPNEGLPGNDIVTGPVRAARAAGICLYTIGFGDKGDLDEALLQNIAAQSGCGAYYYAAAQGGGVLALENGFIRSRHTSVRAIVTEFSGAISQGQTSAPSQFQVAQGQDMLVGTVNWPGSRVKLVLTDPNGQQLDPTGPEVQTADFTGLEYQAIKNPVAGRWQAVVVGEDVPAENEPFNVILSARKAAAPLPETPPPPGSGSATIFVIFVVALVAGVGGVAFFATRRRAAPASAGGLRLVSGQASPDWAALTRPQLQLGRGHDNDVVIADKDASRHHTRVLKTAQGVWAEDLQSTNGTYVNGQPVTRRQLQPGDIIQVGRTQFRYEAPPKQ